MGGRLWPLKALPLPTPALLLIDAKILCDAHITAFDEFWLLGRIPVELSFAADEFWLLGRIPVDVSFAADEFWLLGRIPVDLSFTATFC